MTMPNAKGYEYTKLKDVKVGIANVYGIITDILKENGTTPNGRMHTIITIKDETLQGDKSFRVSFFLLPKDNNVEFKKGWIIRLHRLKVEPWENCVDGRIFRGTDIVIFPSSDSSKIISQAKHSTITDQDKKRVDELSEIVQTDALFEDCEEVDFLGDITFPDEHEDDVEDPPPNTSNSKKVNCDCGIASEVVNPACQVTLRPNPFNANFKRFKNLDKIVSSESNSKKLLEAAATVAATKITTRSSRLSRESSSGSLGVKSRSSPSCKSGDIAAVPGPSTTSDNRKGTTRPPDQNPANSPRRSKRKNTGEDETTENVLACSIKIEFEQQNPEESDLESATVLSKKMKETETPKAARMKGNRDDSVIAEHGSVESSLCPGLACAQKDCAKEPILLDDDDPRLVRFDEKDLITEGLGDIPAAQENGKIISLSGYMPYEVADFSKRVTVADILNDSWPRYRTKVQIIKIKPSIKALQTSPKDLLSAPCTRCGSYTLYSRVQWKKEPGSFLKKPLCPVCLKTGQERLVSLEFRIKLTVRDAWGTIMDLYAVRSHAGLLLGITPAEYVLNEANRKEVLQMLSETISSKRLLVISYMRVRTRIKEAHYIYNTSLKSSS